MVKLESPGVSVRKAQYSSLLANMERKKGIQGRPHPPVPRNKPHKAWKVLDSVFSSAYSHSFQSRQNEITARRIGKACFTQKINSMEKYSRIRQSSPHSITFRKDLLLGEKLLAPLSHLQS